MNSVYEVLNTIGGNGRYLRPCGNLRVTAPHADNTDDRTVTGGNFNRGGFKHGACTVPCDPKVSRARLSVRAMRDTKTRNDDGAYSYTSFVVADYDNGRWVRLNDRFEARLTRVEYDALLTAGCVAPNADLNQLVFVDVGLLPLFPVVGFTTDYLASKRSLLLAEARLAKLKYLKDAARDYFHKKGISFVGLEPKKTRQVGGVSNITVAVVQSYTKVEFVIANETISAAVDESQYRVKVGRSYEYTPEGYAVLKAEIEQVQATVNTLRPTVRLIEMSLLEHMTDDTLTLTVDGETVTVNRLVTVATETFYGIHPTVAQEYVNSNPTATIKGVGVGAITASGETVTA